MPGFRFFRSIFTALNHGQNIARFSEGFESHLIHLPLNQENAQTANLPGSKVCIQVRGCQVGRVERFSVVADDYSKGFRVRVTGDLNITPLDTIIGMFDDVGAGLVHAQLN